MWWVDLPCQKSKDPFSSSQKWSPDSQTGRSVACKSHKYLHNNQHQAAQRRRRWTRRNSPHGLWAQGRDCPVDVSCIIDTEAKSYQSQVQGKVIASQEFENRQKYCKACLKLHWHVTPFVCSTDGLMSHEATTMFAKWLSAKLAEKWQKPYSQICGVSLTCLGIAIVRATQLFLRGSRYTRLSQWEDAASLALFKKMLTAFQNYNSQPLHACPWTRTFRLTDPQNRSMILCHVALSQPAQHYSITAPAHSTTMKTVLN